MDTFTNALQEWLGRAQKIVTDHHNNQKFSFPAPTLTVDPKGKKYIRIVSKDSFGDGGYVFCFIEKETGNVLKAAGWKSPAPHARGNIYQIGREGISAYGANYLR